MKWERVQILVCGFEWCILNAKKVLSSKKFRKMKCLWNRWVFVWNPNTSKEMVQFVHVIRPKHIYNFCLCHACFVWLCHVLNTLPYSFDHIWTNLLTQCTQLPVPVFCCFCISGFPAIKRAPKIPEKLYTKSASRKLPESPRKEGRATTR